MRDRFVLRKLWTALFLVPLLAGCVVGSGGPTGSYTIVGPNGNGQGYEGNVVRTAYQVDPAAKCPDGTVIGYQSKIEVRDDGSQVVRDGCGGEAKSLEGQRLDSLGETLVGYQGGIYEFRTSAPAVGKDERYFIAWCQAVPSRTLGFLIGSTAVTKKMAAVVYEVSDGRIDWTDPFGILVVAQPPLRRILGEPMQAAVVVTPDAIERNLYPGKMRYEGEDRPILCRLLPHQL